MHAGAGASKVVVTAGEAAAGEPAAVEAAAASGKPVTGGLAAQVAAGEQKHASGGLAAQVAASKTNVASEAGAPVVGEQAETEGLPPPTPTEQAIVQVALQYGELAEEPESGELKRKRASMHDDQVGDKSADEGLGSKHRAHDGESDERVQLSQPKPGSTASVDDLKAGQAAIGPGQPSAPLPIAPPSAPHTPVSSPDEQLLMRRRRCVELLKLTPEVLEQTARAGGANNMQIQGAKAEGDAVSVVRALTDMILRREDAKAAEVKSQQQQQQVLLLQQQQLALQVKSAAEAEAARLKQEQLQQQQQATAKAAAEAAAASAQQLVKLTLEKQKLAEAQAAAPPEPQAAAPPEPSAAGGAAATAPPPTDTEPPTVSTEVRAPPATVPPGAAAERDEYIPPTWHPRRVAIKARLACLQFAEGHASKEVGHEAAIAATPPATWPAINTFAVLQCCRSTDGMRFLLCPIDGLAAMMIGGYHTGRDDECRAQDLAEQAADTFLGDGEVTSRPVTEQHAFGIMYPLQSGFCKKAKNKCQGHCDECRLSMMLPEPLALASAVEQPFAATFKVFMWVAASAPEAVLWRRQAQAINPRAQWITHAELASVDNADGHAVASVNMKNIMLDAHGVAMTVDSVLQAPALTEREGWLVVKELSQSCMRATLSAHEGEDYDELAMPDNLAAECQTCGKWMPLCDEQSHKSFDSCHVPNAGEDHILLNISSFRRGSERALRYDELECFTLSHCAQASLGDETTDLLEILQDDDVPVVLLDVPRLTQVSQTMSQLRLDNVRASKVILTDVEKSGTRTMSRERRKSSEGSNHHSQFTRPLRTNIRRVASIVAKKYHPVPSVPKDEDELQKNLFRVLRTMEKFKVPLELSVEAFRTLWNNSHPSCSRTTLELGLELADSAIANARVASNVCSVVGPVACGKTELLTQLWENGFVQKEGPPLVGSPVAYVLFENREAFAPELEQFLRVSEQHREADALAAKDYHSAIAGGAAHSGVPVVHADVIAATLALQTKAAASGVTPNFEDAYVTERSPVCNICFALVALAQGKLSLEQYRQLLFRFRCTGFVPGVAIFIDDDVETCKARARARANKDHTRSAEATVNSVYTDMVHAAHTVIFLGLKQTRMRCEVHRVCLPDKNDANGDTYTEYLDNRLQPTIVAALLRQP